MSPVCHFLLHHICNRKAHKRHRAAVALSDCSAPVSVIASDAAAAACNIRTLLLH